MTARTKTYMKSRFETGDKPTQTDFVDLIDSYQDAGSYGTVTSVSVDTANGLAGSVANASTTPAITLSTTVTGLLKGNGAAISAATAGSDYTDSSFKTIAVSGQSDVVADSAADTLTLAAGSGVSITTNASTDTITIAATSSSILVQQVTSVVTATSTGATTTPFDDTIPQITEGNEFITVTITPTNASNILEFEFDCMFGEEANNDSPLTVALFQGSSANAIYAKPFIDGAGAAAQDYYPCTGKFRMVAGTTSSTTFRLRAGFATGTVRINGSGGARKLGGVISSYLIVKEMTQ